MSIRKMTPEEVREWFGNGIVLPGMKRPTKAKRQVGVGFGSAPNRDQDAHDRRMARMSDKDRASLVKGLGKLARSVPPREDRDD